MSRVPYISVNGVCKAEAGAKPLSERCPWPEDREGKLGMLTCYPYSIVEGRPKEKDERNEEYKWSVYPGMVIRMMLWPDSARGGKADKFRAEMCPEGYDVIPPFTLLELELTCKVSSAPPPLPILSFFTALQNQVIKDGTLCF